MWSILKVYFMQLLCPPMLPNQTIPRTLISNRETSMFGVFYRIYIHGYIYMFGQYTDIAHKKVSSLVTLTCVSIHCVGQTRSAFSSEVPHEAHADRMLQGILQSDPGGDHHPWWHQAAPQHSLCHLRDAHVGETTITFGFNMACVS